VKRPALLIALGLALASVAAPRAEAEEPGKEALAKAREEFRRGLALEVAKDYEGALSVFKGVALVKSSPQVRFHIGVCEEAVGDWVGAIASYRLALLEAKDSKVKDVEEEAQSAIAKLEPRIPKITLHRGAGAGVATVVLDGRELGPASVGAAISVNPGPHSLELSAPGHEKSLIEVVAKEGESQEIAMTLKPRVEVVRPPLGVEEGDGRSPLFGTSLAVMSAGAASLVVSGVFFGLKQSAVSDLDAACGPDGQSCPPDLQETYDNGSLYSTVSTATFIGGLAALGVGGTLLIVELTVKPGSGGAAPAKETAVHLRGAPTGLTLTGKF
jgi:hypothetical protein